MITSRKFSDEERIAICGICTLADAMKPCRQGIKCAFAIGLPFRELRQAESIPVIPESLRTDYLLKVNQVTT